MSALRAKLSGRGKLGSAVGAHRGQVRTALLAVLRPGAIFVPAFRTRHEKPKGSRKQKGLERSRAHNRQQGAMSAFRVARRAAIGRGWDEDFSSPPAHLWTGRALQVESSDGHAVRINLSGLWLELAPPAIMGIRAQRSSLDPRPRRPCAGPGLSCAGRPLFHRLLPLANLGGISITFCLAVTTVMWP